MAGERSSALIQIISKIPIFQKLSPNVVQKLLSICKSRSCETDEVLCAAGTFSEEMFVLISGELTVSTPDGTMITTVKPVTTVGEMGLVTRQERTATIKASEAARVLVLQKAPFENLLRGDIAVQAKIYRKESRPGESHPQALAELYVNVSAHTAPIIQPTAAGP